MTSINIILRTLIFALLSFFCQIASAQTDLSLKSNTHVIPFQRKAFIENKGQFDKLLKNKKDFSYCIDKDYQVFFYKNAFTYHFLKRKHRDKKFLDILRSERKREELELSIENEEQFINVEWLNSNPNATIEVYEKSTTVFSYFMRNNVQKPYTEQCNGYKKLIIKNLYNGIDVEYVFHPTDGIKYNIIASKGADLSQIKLKYTGQLGVELINGELHVKTILGDIIEKQPLTYFTNNSNEIIPSSYLLVNNTLSFNLGAGTNTEITIDPWVVIPGNSGSIVYDNGVDGLGNVYLHGGNSGWLTEKYASTGGLPIWSLANGNGANSYSGDLLVDGLGNFYLCEGYNGGGARTYKYNPSAGLIWQSTSSPDFQEHWRLALDCKNGTVIVGGGGTSNPTKNIAEINVTTGVLTNVKSMYPTGNYLDMSGICVDGTGKCYLLGSGPQNLITTDNLHNPTTIVASGHPFVEIFNAGYLGSINNGYNCMALSGPTFLYTFDGATLKKWNRATSTLLLSVLVPAGSLTSASGVLADECNNVFVGSTNGVYRFDGNLVQQEFKPTPNAVYDIAFSPSGDIIACGQGFSTNLTFIIPPCLFQINPISINSCSGAATGFIKLNLTGGVPTYNYAWTFNGIPMLANADSITGLAPGVYECVFTDSPCNNQHKDSITIIIASVGSPIIAFTSNTVCLGSTTSFTNTSSVSLPSTITTWAWDFDNNGTTDDSIQNPTNLYVTSGTYSVELKAITNFGCKDSLIVSIIVNANPTATFTPVNACEGSSIALNNTSSVSAPDNISLYAWNFGAGGLPFSTSSNSNPIGLNYLTSGVKTITLTITANTSCTSTISQTVTVYPLPNSNFTFVNNCINAQPNTFDASSTTISVGTSTAYAWAYADAGIGAGVIATHNYAIAGVYNVTLTVTSDRGCEGKIVKPVEVYQKPIMSISNSNSCFTKVMTFTANTLPGSGIVNNWFWDINNTVNSIELSGQTNNFTFPAAGNQTINLVSETINGCRDTISKVVYVDYIPSPLFSVNKPNGCPTHCVNFTDLTLPIIGPGVNADWKWVFGDGSEIHSGSGSSQSHCYENTTSNQLNLFDIKLVVTTNKGCTDSLQKNGFITVYPNPIASYMVNPNPGSVVTPFETFTNESIDYTKWWWSFGDGPQIDSVNINPTHFYNSENANTYNSILMVQNQYGCRDTAYVKVEIKPDFSFYIPNAFSPGNEDGINDMFTGLGIGIAKYEMWIYDRWGALIFYTDDIKKGWDGKVKGKSTEVQLDVYVWKVKLVDVLSKKHDYVGHVTVVK